jgi:hypothetical protein
VEALVGGQFVIPILNRQNRTAAEADPVDCGQPESGGIAIFVLDESFTDSKGRSFRGPRLDADYGKIQWINPDFSLVKEFIMATRRHLECITRIAAAPSLLHAEQRKLVIVGGERRLDKVPAIIGFGLAGEEFLQHAIEQQL